VRWLIVAIIFIFAGCATKQPTWTKPALIVWKSKGIKFADSGFVRKTGSGVELEIYEAGTALFRLKVAKRICTDRGCMSAKAFNERFLSPYYPDQLIRNILLARPIFDGKNLIKTEDGFIQKIKSDHLDIIYKINTRSIFFKDRLNYILIKIKELDG